LLYEIVKFVHTIKGYNYVVLVDWQLLIASRIKTPLDSCDDWNGSSSIVVTLIYKRVAERSILVFHDDIIFRYLKSAFRREDDPPDRLIIKILFPIVYI